MSIRALNSAASGMDALSFKLDTIANNLANSGTTAFKRSRTNFEDTFYQHLKLPGILDSQNKPTATGLAMGLGTRLQSTQLDSSNGSLVSTDRKLDVAIVGDGFFQVQDGSQILYTRAGNFALNANGDLVIASADRGRPIEPNINIPADAVDIEISEEGFVSVLQPNSNQLQQVGQLQLAKFINPGGMVQLGENLYQDVGAAGSVQVASPGQQGLGLLRQGFLEASNVEPVRELVDLIATQRNFELNSQVIQAADQALQLVNNLRRF